MSRIFATLGNVLFSCLFAVASPPSGLDGSWAGVVQDGTQTLYLVVTLWHDGKGVQQATIAFPKEGETAFPASGSTANGTTTITALKDGATLFMAGALSGERFQGSYRFGISQGVFDLWPLRKMGRSDLLPFTGDFSDGHGHDVVIGESLGALYFFDRLTGRTGRLYPLSNGSFFGGPSLLIYAPVAVTAQFSFGANDLTFAVDGATAMLHRVTVANLADVTFDALGARISGTLRRPPGVGRFPAVLLLSGSNGQPRSGFYALEDFVADQFARLGFVVLSFDKRGVGDSSGAAGDNGVEQVAAAAFRFLKQQPGIDPARTGIWGMSQGGIIAPKVATLENGVGFIVNESGSIVDANTEEIERTARMMRVDGFNERDIADAVAFQRLKFHYARTGQDWDAYAAAYTKYANRPWFPDPYVGPPASKSSSAWKFWRESGAVQPTEFWRRFTGPVLLLFAQHDTIGDPDENIALFAKTMAEAGNENYTIGVIPGADHSMYEARTGSWREDRLLTNLSFPALNLLNTWVQNQRLIEMIPENARLGPRTGS
ncbi:MAG TPA: alpha/beta fold hydrolase [Candidatus Binatia bacterium]|nr:alpha/beta fold hydrolase [Candidatus Binatia bacterium]